MAHFLQAVRAFHFPTSKLLSADRPSIARIADHTSAPFISSGIARLLDGKVTFSVTNGVQCRFREPDFVERVIV